jgi:hypothetical protein
MYIVIDHNGRPRELVKEYGQLVLLCGIRVTAFPTQKTARIHIATTQAWAKEHHVYWHPRITEWRVRAVSLSVVERRRRAV